ncbi:MAG: transcription termination/antitermination protein NusA [Firmicutes bacterium]|nr:transcription termination/antitermination protein NusA [Bacillota bacterium]
MDGKELLRALDIIEKEKGIDKEVVFKAIELALETACKKNYGTSQNIKVVMNRDTGDVKVYAQKEVVEDVYDAFLEVSLEDANEKGRESNTTYQYGDLVDYEITPRNFGRISAQTAKQMVVQKLREAERENMYNEFSAKEREVETAIVQRVEPKGNVIVNLGKMDAVLPVHEQIPGEEYKFNQRLKVYILQVGLSTKGPFVKVSRTHYELVKRLFELECPEVFEGVVEIKNVSREPGSRTKMAVYSYDENVDAVGSCVGPNGSRVDIVVEELGGEKIDIIPWSENSAEFIAAALRPASVLAVELSDIESKSAKVVVPDEQLSLAIGKEGQNVRLAARLTGWKIDIKSESQARATNFIDFDAYEQDYDADSEEYENDEYSEVSNDDFEETFEEPEEDVSFEEESAVEDISQEEE